MKVWLALPALPPGPELSEYVGMAQSLGLAGVTVSEHAVIPKSVASTYPYTGRSAELPVGTQFPDPLILIASLAASFSTIRFMTNVLLATLRHPLDLARQTATLAAIAGGRFDLGVGAGWMREEFDAFGVPFGTRGRRLDETLGLLRKLWAGEVVEHSGDQFSFGSVSIPTPPCEVPLFVGGNSDAALERAARTADGWVGVGLVDADLSSTIARLREACGTHRHLERPLQLRVVVKGRLVPDGLDRLASQGVDAAVVQAWQVTDRKPSEPLALSDVGEGLGRLVACVAPAHA